ncbi:MAG: ADP-glyceromanno-heptose 6-epimerase [Desulfovibrio sp.]|jgi:ADP-L-glycero-D-manno-heptose 6-epimerase|nr:ADP-glyceromanno-heptose 6-epimerase [Desulfovibrio sp.]
MIVVTGGAGFIGSALICRLNDDMRKDIIVVDNLGQGDKWRNLAPLRYREYIHKDAFHQFLRRGRMPWPVSCVIHLGACSSTTEANADYLMHNNFRYSQRLCRFCLQNDITFVYASSAATYGDGSMGFAARIDQLRELIPLNMYAYSKHLFDCWVVSEGLQERVAGIKFFNVYGPNEYHKGHMRSVVAKAHAQVKNEGRITLFKSTVPDLADGDQKRDFVYVKDCVEFILWAARGGFKGIANMGTGTARSFNDLAKAVFAALGRECRIEYVDMPETLRGAYQNFTQAEVPWIKDVDYPNPIRSLEDGVKDYVTEYLEKPYPYMRPKQPLEP